MEDHTKIIEQLPHAITLQWKAAQREDTPTEWAYVAGMIGGEISRNPAPALMDLHNVAMQNASTAASQATTGKFSLLTPAQRLQELFSITTRMKSHAAILGQFFVRPTTKKTALAGMDTEISNMLVLWELVKADLEVQS